MQVKVRHGMLFAQCYLCFLLLFVLKTSCGIYGNNYSWKYTMFSKLGLRVLFRGGEYVSKLLLFFEKDTIRMTKNVPLWPLALSCGPTTHLHVQGAGRARVHVLDFGGVTLQDVGFLRGSCCGHDRVRVSHPNSAAWLPLP